jgi:hypothetical protein
MAMEDGFDDQAFEAYYQMARKNPTLLPPSAQAWLQIMQPHVSQTAEMEETLFYDAIHIFGIPHKMTEQTACYRELDRAAQAAVFKAIVGDHVVNNIQQILAVQDFAGINPMLRPHHRHLNKKLRAIIPAFTSLVVTTPQELSTSYVRGEIPQVVLTFEMADQLFGLETAKSQLTATGEDPLTGYRIEPPTEVVTYEGLCVVAYDALRFGNAEIVVGIVSLPQLPIPVDHQRQLTYHESISPLVIMRPYIIGVNQDIAESG